MDPGDVWRRAERYGLKTRADALDCLYDRADKHSQEKWDCVVMVLSLDRVIPLLIDLARMKAAIKAGDMHTAKTVGRPTPRKPKEVKE